MTGSLAARLKAGEIVYSGWSNLPDPLTVEALAHAGFDAVTLDMQHGGHDEQSVLRSLASVTAAGKGAVVRIPVGRFDAASRALDFGAEAVIAPMVNSLADARAFATAVKYPPVGLRSWGPAFAMPRHGEASSSDWLADANGDTVSFAMIETRQAFDVLDDILAVPGIDGVFVGPSDFSIAWSGGATIDPTLPAMMDAVGQIAARARAAGKIAAIYVIDPTLASRYVDMGYRFLALGSDQRCLAIGAAALLDTARGG